MNLPTDKNLDTRLLAQIYNNTVATYKFYWFVSIEEETGRCHSQSRGKDSGRHRWAKDREPHSRPYKHRYYQRFLIVNHPVGTPRRRLGKTDQRMKVEGVLQNNGIINDHSGSVNTIIVGGQPEPASPSTETRSRKPAPKGRSAIQLKDFKGNKVNFIRVIKALHKEGFFERESGGKPTEEEVFAAFGIAINEGLDDFAPQLSNNRKDNTPETRADIFDQLKKTYLKYEQDIEDKKKEK